MLESYPHSEALQWTKKIIIRPLLIFIDDMLFLTLHLVNIALNKTNSRKSIYLGRGRTELELVQIIHFWVSVNYSIAQLRQRLC